MLADAPAAVVGRGQRERFAQTETVAQHQALSEVQAVGAQCQRLQATQVVQQDVIGIMVVAFRIVQGEEWLAGILFGGKACLHVFAPAEGIAQRVVEGSAEIILLIALAAVEGQVEASQHLMLAVTPDVFPRRETFGSIHGLHAHKRVQEFGSPAVHLRHQHQLVDALHRPVQEDISLDILHLLGSEEGELFQLFAGGGVQIQRTVEQVGEVLQLVFPSSGVGLLGQFLQVVFQKKQALGIRPERKQQKQGEGEDSPEVFHGFHTVLLRQTKVRKRIGLTSKGERKSAKSRQVDINRPKEML